MTHKMLPSLAGDPLGKLSHVAVNGTTGGALWPILEDSSQDDPQAHFWEWSRDATARAWQECTTFGSEYTRFVVVYGSRVSEG